MKVVNPTLEKFEFECFGNPSNGNSMGPFSLSTIFFLVPLQLNQYEQFFFVRLEYFLK